MKIDFTQPILDLDGNETGLTLGEVSKHAVLSALQGDEHMPATEKVSLFELALKVKMNDELSVEDVAAIKGRIGKACLPLVVGRAFALLDPKS